MTTKFFGRNVLGLAVAALVPSTVMAVSGAEAQQRGSDPEHKLDLTWDRWLDHDEIGERMKLMERTWPEFLDLQSIGMSYGGREMWLMTINNPATGPDDSKAAMMIEANVHGNEIQGAEVILYTIWYLMENYGLIDDVTTDNAAVRGLLDSLARENPLARDLQEQPLEEVTIPASFQVVVQCDDEAQQRSVFERMTAEGFKCRVLSL